MNLIDWCEKHLLRFGMDREEQIRAVRDWANVLYESGYSPDEMWWASEKLSGNPPSWWADQLGLLQELLRGERRREIHQREQADRLNSERAPAGYFSWARAGKPGTLEQWQKEHGYV